MSPVPVLSPTSLLTFRTVVQVGTFRGAAERLAVSQPAVSGHIARLEEELGVKLFQRPYGRSLRLTEAGQLLHRHALNAAALDESFRRSLQAFSTGQAGTVRLGYSMRGQVALTAVAHYFQARPNATLIVRSGSNEGVVDMLLKGEVDIGLAFRTDHPDVVCTPFFREPMLLLVAADHPLAGRRPLRPQDLAGQAFITGLSHSRHHVLVREFAARLGIDPYRVVAQVEDPYHMLALIEAGIGIGALSYGVAEQALRKGSVVPLPVEGALEFTTVTTYLLTRRGLCHPPVVDGLLAFLQQELAPAGLPITLQPQPEQAP